MLETRETDNPSRVDNLGVRPVEHGQLLLHDCPLLVSQLRVNLNQPECVTMSVVALLNNVRCERPRWFSHTIEIDEQCSQLGDVLDFTTIPVCPVNTYVDTAFL